MLEIGALFAFIGRQIGRLVQTAFSWATLVLFGRVASDKQLYLSLMAVLALLWPIALAGVALPSVATFLLGFVTVPDGFHGWVRLGLLVVAALAPLGVGFLGIKLREQMPRGTRFLRALAAGYPNALALAVVLIWLMVITPITKVITMVKRYESAHVPISVHEGGYDVVVDDLRGALERAGVQVRHTFAPWTLTVPGRILGLVGGAGVRALVPQRLSQLRGRDLVMTIHPMDLAITGKARAVAAARGALVRELTFTRAYQTWSKEAHEIEDLLDAAASGRTALATIGRRLDDVTLNFEEWEILYRMFLQVRLRRARVIGGDEVNTQSADHVGIRERIEAAVAALTARP